MRMYLTITFLSLHLGSLQDIGNPLKLWNVWDHQRTLKYILSKVQINLPFEYLYWSKAPQEFQWFVMNPQRSPHPMVAIKVWLLTYTYVFKFPFLVLYCYKCPSCFCYRKWIKPMWNNLKVVHQTTFTQKHYLHLKHWPSMRTNCRSMASFGSLFNSLICRLYQCN